MEIPVKAEIIRTPDGWVVRVGRWVIAQKPTEGAAKELRDALAKPGAHLNTTHDDIDLFV
jgi:hypothetical protein